MNKKSSEQVKSTDIQQHVLDYLDCQPESKRSDMKELHRLILNLIPGCRLWFLDGKNNENKVVSNPNIGYGHYNIEYADGTTREFYQIGMCANTSGISVYVMGIQDRKYLSETFGQSIGKASVTGYCIKFKTLNDISIETLEQAIRYGYCVNTAHRTAPDHSWRLMNQAVSVSLLDPPSVGPRGENAEWSSKHRG